MKRRGVLAAAALLSAGCAGIVPEQESAPPPDADEWELREDVEGSIASGSATNLVLDDSDFGTAGDHVRVRGTVRNTQEEAYPGVEIDVALLSEGGDTIESTERERDASLGPGDTWRFAVVIEDVDVSAIARYEIETGGESAL